MGWTFLVLIPKDITNTWVIGLLETLWKVIAALIDTCLRASLQFHDIFHRFQSGRGTGMAIMELNLVQELAIVDHGPLLLVFFDLRKAYDTVNRDRLIQTLEGYDAGPRMYGLLETLLAHEQVVPIHNGYHRPSFPATRETTQVSLVSPTLFNIVVDNAILTWLAMKLEYQRVYQYGLVETVGQCLGVFYNDDNMVGSRDPDWLQHLMNVPISFF